MANIPALTENAIERMCSGKVVEEPVLQILASEVVQHLGLERISLLLSDGQYSNICYMDPSLNESHPPEPLTIVKLNQYRRSVSDKLNDAEKAYIEIDALTVLATCTATSLRIGCPEKYDEDTAPRLHTVLRSNFTSEKAKLTKRALARIMAGEAIVRPVVQIISAKMVRFRESERLVLVVCDSRRMEQVSCSPAMTELLVQVLEHLKLSIVQLDEYVFANEWIEIVEMTWINLGSEICFETNLLTHRASLTRGVLSKLITAGQWVSNPIVRIMRIETVKIESESKQRMCLLVTDGRNSAYAYLSTQLARSLQGALTNRSIVRFDVFKSNQLSSTARQLYPSDLSSSVTVFALTLLNVGLSSTFEWKIMPALPILSVDFLSRLMGGEQINKPVVKVVKVNFILNGTTEKNHIRLLIYDGNVTCHAVLPSYMNHLREMLEGLPTVRIEEYETPVKNEDEYMLVLLEMTGVSNLAIEVHPTEEELNLLRVVLPILEEDA